MTTTSIVQEEIGRFLKGTTPEVLCVTGKWGVGKTFLWKQEILAAQAASAIGLKRYAYVSLFGQNSLSDLKSAIVEETVDVGSIGSPDISSIKSPLRWKSALVGWTSRALMAVPKLREYVIDASRILFAVLVRNQIVCLDDLERAGSGLTTNDVLGLVSFLKEERKCRVVLLLNQRVLEEEDKSKFEEHVEKVIDTRLEFQPTSQEAARIAIPSPTESENNLIENCALLEITNIRVIQKIRRLVSRLDEALEGFGPAIRKQAVHSVTLFGWVIYQPREAPNLSEIIAYNPFEYIINKETKSSPEQVALRTLLNKYGFSRVDEFDQVILEGVRSGYFDVEKLREHAGPIVTQLQANHQNEAFKDAWRLYHNSFTIGADEVLNAIEVALRAGIQAVSPANLSGTITLFKDLGQGERAVNLIQYYMEKHAGERREFFDLANAPFGSEVNDPDVIQAFATKLSTFVIHMDPKAVLERIVDDSGWNPEDIELLSGLSAGDFVRLFKEASGPKLGEMVRVALRFGSHSGAGEKRIADNAAEALRRISSESAINARRVASYGIN